MRLAFYAPMKPSTHPTPSGDRAMARSLIAAFEHLSFTVDQPSTFCSRDGKGDAAVQDALIAKAQTEIVAVLCHADAPKWQAWITYHNYYKAPDLIGPLVARQLGIPYLLIEATRARKRLAGPWAGFAQASEAASDAANAMFYLTERDAEALVRDAPDGQHLIHLRPFLPLQTPPPATQGRGPMLAVGMMRHADKLPSYRMIAQTLEQLDGTWELHIAGDGPARDKVHDLMRRFGDRVTFLGRLSASELAAAYAGARLLFWPGVNEAFGLAYLEAQAHGLPVVAQDRPGVREVLAPGDYPSPEEGPAPLARRLSDLLTNDDNWQKATAAAADFVAKNHLLPAAANTLRAGLEKVGAI